MKLKGLFHCIIMFILLFGLAWAVQAASVAAQATPALAVDPAQVDLPLGQQFVIELTVTDGVGVNGFDIKLTYGQGQLSLLGWEHGGYLESPSCDNEIKSPGLLELECKQDGGSAASGNGVLLALTFETLALGTADMTLEEAVFVDVQGLETQPNRANGVVNVQNLPTWTPTATMTSTPTLIQTSAVTLTPTQAQPTPTTIPPTNTPTLTPSPTLLQGQDTPTLGGTLTPGETLTPEGTPSKTLTTPISGVARPSRRTGTTTAAVMTDTPTESGSEDESSPKDRNGSDGINDGLPADQQKTRRMGFCGRLLLGVGVFLLVALVVLILLRIRRRKGENEDLLL